MSRPENPIGFVLLTHSKPHQIQRLVRRLNSMFDGPPIVIHHDFGKCPLSAEEFPGNVSFVRPHLDTGWGTFNSVAAIVQAVTQLYDLPDAPDWCALLSGSCYPTKPAAQILADLMESRYDVYLNGRKVGLEDRNTEWHRERYQRYCVKRIAIPSVDRRLRPRMRDVPLPQALGNRLLPFSESLQCYAGGHWFTINRRAAEYLVDFQKTPANLALANHYQNIPFADESYFQTVLYNASSLSLSHDNWRHIDWSEHQLNPTGHPKQLTLADLPALQASPTHFARKIDIDTDSDLLDALDQVIDTGAAASQKMVSL